MKSKVKPRKMLIEHVELKCKGRADRITIWATLVEGDEKRLDATVTYKQENKSEWLRFGRIMKGAGGSIQLGRKNQPARESYYRRALIGHVMTGPLKSDRIQPCRDKNEAKEVKIKDEGKDL